ncbi:GDSL esterase/lipase APG-like [Spinacia oleracea]|uniref:GDSL esterase/lipase APG-like n=1 Tax=Spinacia oleracea TaxID=3562 RepID=A0ABM3RQ71_SPIOL|nr:GDSL esterase/lipase APG-like [Spinacia oleracea]
MQASILLLTPAFARLILRLNLQPPEFRAVSLTQQLGYYKEYQSKVTKLVGIEKAKGMFSAGIHLLGAGNSDYLQNYNINTYIYRQYTPDQFADLLMTSFSNFVQLSVTDMNLRKPLPKNLSFDPSVRSSFSVDQYESDLQFVVQSLLLSMDVNELQLVKSGLCYGNCIRYALVKLLRSSGYNAAICTSNGKVVTRCLEVHPEKYLDSLQSSSTVAQIVENGKEPMLNAAVRLLHNH